MLILKNLYAIAFFICVSFPAIAVNTGPLSVEPVEVSRIDQISDPKLRELLQELKAYPANIERYPEMKRALLDVTSVVRELANVELDGLKPIRVMLIDDLGINAAFVRDESSGIKTILVNTGTVAATRTNDELAYVIAHELEHGTAQIGEYIEEVKKSRDRESNNLMLSALKRIEENEVDVKALRRMHNANYNPYAAEKFLVHMEDMFGNAPSITHTNFSSRRNAVASALTAVKRGSGIAIDVARLQKNTIVAPFNSFIRSKKYASDQHRELEILLNEPILEIDKTLKAIKDETLNQSIIENIVNSEWGKAGILSEVWNNLSNRAEAIMPGEMSPAERLDYKLRLSRSIHERYWKAYESILGKNFKPKLAKQVIALTKLSEFELIPRLVGRGQSLKVKDVATALNELREKESQLSSQLSSKALAEDKLHAESELKSLRPKIANMEAELETLRTAYLPGENNRRDAIIERMAKIFKDISGANYIPEEYFRLEKELQALLKYDLQNLSTNAATQKAARFRNWLPNLEIDLGNISEFSELNRLIGRMVGASDRLEMAPKLFASLEKSFSKALATADPEARKILFKRAISVWGNIAEGIATNSSFKSNNLNLPLEQRKTFIESVVRMRDEFAKYAKSEEELSALFPVSASGSFGSGNLDSVDFDEEYRLLVSDSYRPQFLHEFFLNSWIDKRIALLQKDAKNAKSLGQLLGSFDKLFKEIQSGFTVSDRNIDKITTKGLSQFRQSAIGIFQEQVFAKYPSRVAQRYAESLFFLRYPQAQIDQPISANQAKLIISDLNTFRKDPVLLKQLENALSAMNISTIAQKAGINDKQTIIDSGRLIGNWGGPTPLKPEEFNQLYKYAQEFAENDPSLTWIAGKMTHGNNRALLSGDQRMALFHANTQMQNASFHRIYQKNSAFAPRARWAKTFEEWGSAFGSAELSYDWIFNNDSGVLRGIIKTPNDLLDIVPGYIQGSLKALEHEAVSSADPKERERLLAQLKPPQRRRLFEEKIQKFEREAFGNASIANLEQLINKMDPHMLGEYLLTTIEYSTPKQYRDFMFNRVWNASQTDPTLKKYIRNPKLVQTFMYQEIRTRLAKWQIDDRFKLQSRSAHLLDSRHPVQAPEDIRETVKSAKIFVETQFPNISGERTSVIEHLEQKIMTTRAENEYLQSSRINTENWMQAPDLVKLDLPYSISGGMKSNLDRLEFIDYLVGLRSDLPRFARESSANPFKIANDLESIKKTYAQADILTRSFMTQSLIDEKIGILGDNDTTELLYKNILGPHYNEPMLRELFTTYLKVVPDLEKKVIIAYIYSSFANSNSRRGASIKTILESMGPFGIKAGQFLRSSGRLGPELRAELDNFFNNAIPPSRPKIHSDLKRVFGDQTKENIRVRDLVGSGSINYGVRVDFGAEDMISKPQEAVIRLRRESAIGQIQNENKNWDETIKSLRSNKNEDVRKMAMVLDEARLSAMDTLKEGGIELDLGYERRAYKAARQAYEAGINSETGLKIEVIKPLETLQQLIPSNLQDSVSVYEYIPNQKFSELKPVRQNFIAQQILNAEMRALRNGTFDPDGHIGNWLIDEQGSRLVRIDYAQLYSIDPQKMKRILSVINALFIPSMSENDLKVIVSNLGEMIEFPPNLMPKQSDLQLMIKKITSASDFPNSFEPHQRFLYLRNQIESELSQKMGKEIRLIASTESRAVLSSLGRMLYYRDFIPEKEFGLILQRQLDTPIERIWLQRKTQGTGPIAKVIDMTAESMRQSKKCAPLFRWLFEKIAK